MRWVKWTLVILLILALGIGAYGFWTVRRSFPQVQGELALVGLHDPVQVIRDDWGVAHIYARSSHDLFYAQGYTHAQERFWQMDFWRHIGAGRLSEMFGEAQVEADKFLRSLDLVGLAERELAAMPDRNRDVLEAYAEGVNAYLADHWGAEVSLEYAILPLQNSSYEIEPWTPINTLTWAKMMSWDLSSNMRSEIARAVLSADLAVERVEQLYPPYPSDHPVIVSADQAPTAAAPAVLLPPEARTALASAGASALELWALTGGGFEGIGSNNWVLGGSLTESGMPLLANDPHLAIQMPSIWFAIGLHCVGNDPGCPYQLAGLSFAGVPGVVIGHNEHIAWGVTTETIDTQDLYIERVNPDNPRQYEVDGGWVDFETRIEEIRVAGGETVDFEVRSTRHGPVISGTFLEDGELDGSDGVDLPETYAVSLAWQSLQPSTLAEALDALNRATTHEEFRTALSLWDIAGQNFVYADIEGNIAYQSTGEVPIRANGDGRWPVPGWASEYEWTGLVPFEEMPYLLNPPRDYIATANQAILPPGSDPLIGIDGAYGYRADRIETLINGNGIHSIDTSQEMQLDGRDGGAAQVVPFLLEVADAGDERVLTMKSWLGAWAGGTDPYQARGDSTGAAVYQAAWRHLLANLFHDELPEEYWPEGGSRWFEVVGNLLPNPADPWWDDVDTAAVEQRDEILFNAMSDAHADLSDLLGPDPDSWSWGRLHLAHFENQTFGRSGIGPIEWLFNRTAPDRVSGSTSIVNAAGWAPGISYQVDWLPSMRMVIDLSDFARSTFIHTTGNSGHAFNRFYDNMISSWTDGKQAPMYWTPEQVALNATATLTLVPAGD